MHCGDAMGQRLSKYVDNELAPEERRNVEEHLKSCSGCKDLLSIFLRNESMLSKSLATEQYGEEMIDRVLDRLEEAPEAEPAEETRWERTTGWLRERPWIQLAAAAVFVIALVAVIMTSHGAKDRELGERIADVEKKQQEAFARVLLDQNTAARSWGERLDQVYSDLLRERQRGASSDAPDKSVSAYIEYDALVVHAKFVNREQYVSFTVWRADEVNGHPETFRELRTGLGESHYADPNIVPGCTYWYRFTARKKNLETVDSVPVRLQAPLRGMPNPQESLRIRCVEISKQNDMATFTVTRMVSGQPVTYYFTVIRGQALGRLENGVDFRTDLELDTIESGDETMKVTFAWPKFDPETREPIYDTFGQQAYEMKDQVLSIRPNKRAVLRPIGAPSGQRTVKVWRDSEILAPLAK